MSIFQSSRGYLAAGYSSIAWSSEGNAREDKEAFVCSLTNKMKVFRPNNPSFAVHHHSDWGPDFNYALAVINPMNGENAGWSHVKDT